MVKYSISLPENYCKEDICMKRTAIYARVSTDNQAKEGDSIPAQVTALKAYVDAHKDLRLVGEYIDEGISGRKFQQRDELQRLLDDVRAGKIDIIAFTKLDRWFRSVKHYSATQELLDKYHVDWIAIWESMLGTATPSGRLIVNQMISIAQYEAENTGSRIRQVFEYKVQQGEVISGHVPRGYVIQNKHLSPGPEADTVVSLFEFFSRNGNLTQAANFFHEKTGEGLSNAAIKAMLQNPKYIGEFRNNPNYCPPLISRELFEDVQRKLTNNIKNSAKYDYIFSGLIVCEECGRRFGSYRDKKPRKEGHVIYPAYRCKNHYTGLKTCSNTKVILEKTMEAYLLDNLPELAQKCKIEYSQKQKPAQDIDKQKQAILRRMNRLKELYLNELISLDEYKNDREQYSTQLEELDRTEAPKPRDFSALNKLTGMDLKTVYGTLSNAERRYLWRSVIQEIRIDRERNIAINFL